MRENGVPDVAHETLTGLLNEVSSATFSEGRHQLGGEHYQQGDP